MNDRMLLELAAKAAGIEGHWDDDRNGLEIAAPWRNFTNYETWNPLTDDGDALRLAVKLRIDLMNETSSQDQRRGQSVTFPLQDDYDSLTVWYTDEDTLAATRRAIVRAAAAIAEQTNG